MLQYEIFLCLQFIHTKKKDFCKSFAGKYERNILFEGLLYDLKWTQGIWCNNINYMEEDVSSYWMNSRKLEDTGN
jgi:hypothetical protein